ncbi:hypothetical protein HJP15_07525 [Pseudoalteromonas sp. NEC-BIFX-2020_002]|uniref:hypothetical protein n=1 Tax=Pseudoalteromonas sp. NEC-BIFX-2020_002 TaxID=2732353 RepID=UPI001477470B|nr:hypothetical protein [Pseudoalteromonas sp. NEC-BIFX-2020_002]NNG42768.1 hypothetical protein [Pseudoalteromonas sp. NEC-BIFX-2020_002]
MSNEIEVDPIDVMDISVLTDMLRQFDAFTLTDKLCQAVAEYWEARYDPEYAARFGGIDGFLKHLLGFIDEWLASDIPNELSLKPDSELTIAEQAALAAVEFKALLNANGEAFHLKFTPLQMTDLAVRWHDSKWDLNYPGDYL